MKAIVSSLLLCASCGGAPFAVDQLSPVIMTEDASSESTSVGSEPVIGQSEPLDQADGAVLPMDVDSGDASIPERDAKADHYADSDLRAESDGHNDGLTEASYPGDASPDSFVTCVASGCTCPSGYVPCCKSVSACGCVSAVFPQGCY